MKPMPSKRSRQKGFPQLAALAVASLVMLAAAIGLLFYSVSQGKSSPTPTTTQSVPSNPRKSAFDWTEKLMSTTSKKYGTDFFDSGSPQLKKLISGDTSFIPASIKDSMHFGESTDGMSVSRTTLNGSSYAGLIMFANAYKQTQDKKIKVPGYEMSSYDPSTKTVYIPAQAMLSTDQTTQFEVSWRNGKWVLDGDSLGWSLYSMLRSSASESSQSSSSSGK